MQGSCVVARLPRLVHAKEAVGFEKKTYRTSELS